MEGKTEFEFLTSVCTEFRSVTLDPTVSKETAVRTFSDRQEDIDRIHAAAQKYHGWVLDEYGAGEEATEVAGYMNSVGEVSKNLGDLWSVAIFGRRVFCEAYDASELRFQQNT